MPILTFAKIDALPDAKLHQRWSERELAGPVVNGVTYAAFTITLWWLRDWTPKRRGSDDTDVAAICFQVVDGSGTRLYRFNHDHLIASFITHWIAMPNEALFAVLHTIHDAQIAAYLLAEENTARKYQQAFLDGRLVKHKGHAKGTYAAQIFPAPEEW